VKTVDGFDLREVAGRILRGTKTDVFRIYARLLLDTVILAEQRRTCRVKG